MISRRMCRRHGSTFIIIGLCACLLVFWNRSRLQTAINGLRNRLDGKTETNTNSKPNFHRQEETIHLVESLRRETPVSNQKVAPLNSSKCSLDVKSGVFSVKDDIYETLSHTSEEIYSEKFKTRGLPQKPVFDNPVIRLHPDRFILPLLIRGPNNQLIGLRETIYVAIALNRTLVIPRFTKHRTDSQLQSGSFIHPAHRVDFNSVCKLISCITLRQFREGCGNQVDVVLRLRFYSKKRISEMEASTGMRFSRIASQKDKDINYVPPQPKDKKETFFGPNKNEINKLFNTQERCAIYGQPFYNLKVKMKPGQRRISSQADLASLSDKELYSEVIRRAPAPKYIRNIADEFTKTITEGNKFLSVHWRYDKKDWMKRCSGLDDESKRKELCKEAALVEPVDVAQAILQKLESLKRSAGEIARVYIASPPSQAGFIRDITKILGSKKISVYSLMNLRSFIDSHYSTCDFLKQHLDDIESTIEMQICLKGTVFLRSTRSSWSSNVIDFRRLEHFPGTVPSKDEDILLLTNQMREKRERNQKKSA